MAIVVQCPNPTCGITSKASDTISGRKVRCKKCSHPFVAYPGNDGEPSDTKKSQHATRSNPFPSLPSEFGRYRVLRLLGQGGMGAVYLAEDSQLGRQVALKIPFFNASESQERLDRFIREAQSAAALHHPNICTVFDAGKIDGKPFITMAYIEGTPLDQLIDSDELMPQRRVAEIARKIAIALLHAHSKGTVHRDLKPANVMIAANGEPVVMDFGLAKRLAHLDPDEAKLTRDGGILGTPSYMSPEQVRGDVQTIGPATDIYSLGVILFEMLTGRAPYSGSLGMVMGQILSAPVPTVAEFRPDVDPRLDLICQKAMVKHPKLRIRNMSDFAEALNYSLSTATVHPSKAVQFVDVELVEPSPPSSASSPATETRIPHPPEVEASLPFSELAQATTSKIVAPKVERALDEPRAAWPRRYPAILAGIVLAIVVGLALVLRIETPAGTLLVEIDDPAVEAKIKDGKLVLSGSDGKNLYTLSPTERDKKLVAGEYKMRVEGADGLTLDTTEFTVKKGDKVTVRVSLEKKSVAPPEPLKSEPENLDPDRKAAEYVLSIGGWVKLNNEGSEIRTRDDLPKGKFHLTHAYIYERPCTNEGLAAFRDCEELTVLAIRNSNITDRGLEFFSKTTKLTTLDLRYTTATHTGLKAFAKNKHLQELMLDDTKIGDRSLSNFCDCSELKSLALQFTNISDDGILKMASLKNLTSLNLSGTNITDIGFAKFKDSTEIDHLRLIGSKLTESSLSNFSQCKKLIGVDLSNANLTDKGLSHLTFENASWVKLGNTAITDVSLIKFENCPRLSEIDIFNTKVTAKGVANLKKKAPSLLIFGLPPER